MNEPILPEDVIGVIKEFADLNAGDEATCAIIYAIGAQILGISTDTLIEKL